MGTPCFIAKEIGENQYRTIYCNFDGYLEHVGVKLARHYNTEEMVDKLLELGDISCLYENLTPDPNKPHDELHQQKGVTLAYGRDCGVKDFPATIKTLDELDNDEMWTETTYIFTKDKEWKYFHIGHLVEGLKELAPVVEKIEAIQEQEAQDEDLNDEDVEETMRMGLT